MMAKIEMIKTVIMIVITKMLRLWLHGKARESVPLLPRPGGARETIARA